MTDNNEPLHEGVHAILVWQKSKKTKEELVRESMADVAANAAQGKKHAADVKNRADGKRKSSLPRRKEVAALHAKLKKESGGKNPPWKIFIAALQKIHPDDRSVDGGINEWWKKLNKGESLF